MLTTTINFIVLLQRVIEEYSSKRAVLGVNQFVEFEEDRITLDIPMAAWYRSRGRMENNPNVSSYGG